MRASNALIRASTFWDRCEWEDGGEVNESMTAMARADPTNLNLIDLISVPLIFRRYRNNRHASELRMLSGAGSKYLWIWKFKLNQTSVMQFKPNCQLTESRSR
jgi:hypothetical protein